MIKRLIMIKQMIKKKKDPKGFISTDKDYLKKGANSKYNKINAYKAIPVESKKEK